MVILWMEEILHHQKDGWNPINNGINLNHLSTGAGFLPSTVLLLPSRSCSFLVFCIRVKQLKIGLLPLT
jgi:hypothetical protein